MTLINETEKKPVIGITIGDVNGIGSEIIMKVFMDARMLQSCTPIIYGSSKVISYHRKNLNLNDFNFNIIRFVGEASQKKINIINCWEEEVRIEIGKSTDVGGKYSVKALQHAVKDLNDKKLDALVTAPVNKKNMQQEGFNFPGQTEFFASQTNTADYAMMLVSDKLKVALVSGHVPVKDIAQSILKEKIISKVKVINQSLKRDFGIRKPRIAVLALNPHAGDDGLIGKEEQEIIIPAVNELSNANITVAGPFSADGFFGTAKFKSFDAVLAMYHDQGLIPFKSLSFSTGVNFTAGLPVIRTSPDHGTAFDIAGKNMADEDSLRQAIFLACDIANTRAMNDEATANPLPFSKMGSDR